MPAATKWRAVGVDAEGALHLTDFRLLSGGAPVVVDTLTSTFAPGAGSLSALVDGDPLTSCTFDNGAHRAPSFSLEWTLATAADVTDATAEGTLLAATIQYLEGGLWRTAFRCVPGRPTDTLYPRIAALWRLDGSLLGEGSEARDLEPYEKGAESWVTGLGGAYAMSARFDGQTPGRVLRALNNGVAAFGTGDFEIGMWVWMDASASAHYARLLQSRAYLSAGGWAFTRNGSAGPPSVYFWRSGDAATVVSSSAFSDKAWHYLAVRRKGGITGIFIDGYLQQTAADTNDYTAGDLAIGGSLTAEEKLAGAVNEVLIIKGVSRPLASYSPSTTPLPTWWAQPDRRTVTRQGATLAASTPLSPSGVPVHRAGQARDMEFGGRASIVGDVGIKGAGGAPDTMVKSRVRLFRQRDGLLARETWSDPVTGAFAFDGLDESQQFVALAEDGSGVYAPVAADRRVPGVPA